MNNTKVLIVMIFFIFVGIIFFVFGMIFLSGKFLTSMGKLFTNEDKNKKSINSSKVYGYISLGIGGLTIFCGIMAKIFPQIFAYLALFYVICLIVSFVIIFTFLSH